MMKLKANRNEFEKWISCVPQDGDLIFLKIMDHSILKNHSFEILSKEQIRTTHLNIWSLNNRSWYGYALSNSDYCLWLPSGELEGLSLSIKNFLMNEQIQIKVPTIIQNRWITSFIWNQMSLDEKIQIFDLWAIHNEIPEYDSVNINDLPTGPKYELERVTYNNILNQYSSFSGPNCFSTTASAIVNKNNVTIRHQWMHWPKLENYLIENDFIIINSLLPKVGDVLIFSRDNNPIHSSFYLGDGFYFEKTGQDFYEPYRIALFENWQKEWPETKLILWRRK